VYTESTSGQTCKNLKKTFRIQNFYSTILHIVALCLSDAVKDTTYGTAGRRHGQQLMMAKDGKWTQRSAADFTFYWWWQWCLLDYWHCARRSKLPISRTQRCKTTSGDLHPRKLMSISRSISSRKMVNLHIINICCPQKWGGQNTLRPPTSKSGGIWSGGTCPPVHPMIDAHAYYSCLETI